MRMLFALGASLVMVLATQQPTRAQSPKAEVEEGHAYAKEWCTGCHRVDSEKAGVFAADFAEVAKLPSTTALSLKVFLQTSHKDMPNFILNPAEADAIIAYILSLKPR
ncbi:MAG: cytochrome c [Alphaproteobacteria bacterium]|nr:cytochrome c [Alphaproteobacteria bacterium]